jgi:hypothetical protein
LDLAELRSVEVITATNPKKMNPGADTTSAQVLFPKMASADRAEQKRRLL